MKKSIIYLCIIIALFISVGCTNQPLTSAIHEEEYYSEIIAPQLYVSFSSETVLPQTIRAVKGAGTWTVCDDEENCVSFMQDSLHSLQISQAELDTATLYLENGSNTIELQFDQNGTGPLSVSVRRWNEDSIAGLGTQDVQNIIAEDVSLESVHDTIFIVADGEHNYRYEVHAIWPEGNFRFTFRAEKAVSRAPQFSPLLFNEAEHVISVTPNRTYNHLIRELTDEEFNAAFYGFNLSLNAYALFQEDGTFSGITAYEFELAKPWEELERELTGSILSPESESPFRYTGLVIGFGEWHFNTTFADGYDNSPIISDIHGVAVKAFSADIGHPDGVFFQAAFELDEIPYNITLWSVDVDEGKERLTEVVNLLILNSPDLAVFDDIYSRLS